MNLDIDSIKTFIAVADTKGFTNAGRFLSRSQPSVSVQIKRLEQEVDKRLFHRKGNRVQLTPAGSLLLAYARRIVKAHDDAVFAITPPALTGKIRIGAPEYYIIDILPKLLKEYSLSYPEAHIDLRCETNDTIIKAIESGELDLGLCTQRHLEGQVIYNDPVVWIAKPGYNFEEGKRLLLAVSNLNCIIRSFALAAIEGAGIDHQIAYVSQSIAGLLSIVRNGLAIAPMVASAVPSDLTIVGVESGLPVLPVSNVVLHRSKSQSSGDLTHFSELLIRSFGEKCKLWHPC